MSIQGTVSGWQLDDTGAEAYERELVPRFFAPGADDLVDAVGLGLGDDVLDAACGTGAVARRAARIVGREGTVTAVDVSPAMLAVARRAAGDAGITYELADVTQLPLPDRSVDAVLCQQALQFFPDRTAALTELRRVARPDGRLALSTCRGLEHQPGYRALIDALTYHVGGEAAAITASPYALGDANELRALLRETGWREVEVRIRVAPVRFASPDGFLLAETGSSPLGMLVEQLDADVRSELSATLTAALQPHTDDRGVCFPFETLVATARC